MNDEAADKRDPSAAAEGIPPAAPTSESATDEPTEPITPRPSAWTPPAGGVPEADAPPAGSPPPPGAGPTPPPWGTGPGFSRAHLIRPKQGRYIAGVSGALARATNTDPILWRVLLAVLGVMSGVGVLLYLIGWLVIPAEGDTASPIESLLGKGRSTMSPLSVVLLGGGAVLTFAFIVQDGVRAGLLAAAVILAAVLLIKRGQFNGSSASAPPEAATFPGTPGPAPGAPPPASEFPTAPFAATASPAATATEPVTEPLPPRPPQSAYRPPFAPHGPYAQQAPPIPPMPPMPPIPQVPSMPQPKRPPRERSKLGRLTFFAVVVVLGLMAAIDMAGASIAVSVYFAAALVTIALGLVVGAWLGRARGLIALGLIASLGLIVSTGAERWGGEIGNSVYRPATIQAIPDRYDFDVGNVTIDLHHLNFADQQPQNIAVHMKFGQLKVLLPENVDTTGTVQMDNGRAQILGKNYDGREVDVQRFTDLGSDGAAGGGTLNLDLQMDTGNLEVLR
jgi:phage shock protein PspC (stress-responsive transcriptional regulator)